VYNNNSGRKTRKKHFLIKQAKNIISESNNQALVREELSGLIRLGVE
jgi:hypothetical protein